MAYNGIEAENYAMVSSKNLKPPVDPTHDGVNHTSYRSHKETKMRLGQIRHRGNDYSPTQKGIYELVTAEFVGFSKSNREQLLTYPIGQRAYRA